MTYDPYADPRPPAERVTVERGVPYAADPPVRRVDVIDHPAVLEASPVDRLRRIVWLLFGVLQALIVLRVILLLLGAHEGNDIVGFITGVTDPFVEPFRGMFSLDSVTAASGSVLDVAALIAFVGWTLVEALVLGIVGLADRRATAA